LAVRSLLFGDYGCPSRKRFTIKSPTPGRTKHEGREKLHGPYKGRLANSLTVYPETLKLKTEISLQPVGTRPLFRIEETDHLLAEEQSAGISRARAMELASFLLPQER
jgi:hypothetical protein